MPNPNNVVVGIWKGEQRRFRDGVLIVGVAMPSDDPVPQSTFDAIADDLGGSVESAHPHTGWMVVAGGWSANDIEMKAKELKQNNPGKVTFAQPDFVVETAQGVTSFEPYGEQWGLRAIDMLEAWGLAEGSPNVLIAVVDTGLPMKPVGGDLKVFHEDLDPNRFLHGVDVLGVFPDAVAENPHGLEVTGVMAAKVTVKPIVVAGEGMKGINLVSPVFPCRAVEDSMSSVSYVRDGIEEVLKVPDRIASGDLVVPAAYRGISKVVVNVSLTVPDSELPDDALNELMDRIDDMPWALLCCSTGTVDLDLTTGTFVPEVKRYPAAFSLTHPTSVVAVGGTELSGTKEVVYSDSAQGDHVTLVAPAQNILTTFPMVTLKYGSTSTKYDTVDGTSLAAPFATAIASLVWSKCPIVDAEDVIKCLTGGCEDVPATYGETMDPKAWGHGRVNAFNSIPDVKVVSPGLAFVDVASGDWLALPIEVQVKSPIPLTLHSDDITVDPGSSPGTQFRGTTVTVGPSASAGAYDTVFSLTVEYHGTAPGNFGSALVRVRCDEFGEDWVHEVRVTGNTHNDTSFFVVCADKSGSMKEASGVGTKTRKEVLEESAGILFDTVPGGQALEAISFDGNAHTGLGAMVIDDDGATDYRQVLKNFVEDLAAEGSTSIGDAVEMAQGKLDAATAYDNRAMILLTDGKQTAPKYLSEVSVSSDVYAIGMGMPGPVDAVTLTALVSGNPDGYLLMTGPSDLDDEFKIAKYLQQILCDINNVDIAADPTGRVRAGVPVRIPFQLTDADTRAEVVVMMPKKRAITVTLEAPDHRTVDPEAAGIMRSGDHVSICTLDFSDADRDVFASYAGLWNVVLNVDEATLNDYRDTLTNPAEIRRVKTHGMLYTVAVNVQSSVRMKVGLVQDEFTTDSNVTLSAVVRESGIPITGRVQVNVHMLNPNGTTTVLPLRASSPGIYEVTRRLTAAGVYQCRFVATGLTRTAQPFTREHTRTAFITSGTTRILPSFYAPPSSP